jgi:hypothetical protein
MKPLNLLLSCSLFFSSTLLAETEACLKFSPKQANVIGAAYEIATQELIYCEFHIDQGDNQRVVEYRTLQNELIAKKILDFSPGLIRPWVNQQDMRNGELRIVKALSTSVQNDVSEGIEINYQKANKGTNTEPLKKATLPINETTVIDAGFDNAIKNSWSSLISGSNLKIDFVSPVHLRAFKLSISKSNGRLCQKTGYDSQTQVCFLIRPANALIKAFVKPLVLVYDQNSQKLESFSGSVNIVNSEGKTWKAKIIYSYL